ncbi:hypothetical protein JDV02_008269 [Purpureocillium takamizusanense]|uniref:Uncharacterized protein n=1 Tax=Purpureocillium takamizusanense TaxID=2060973 RepID=A0A9Q8QJU5_9HYPO|nr:uncharacterized protein JDV02_008269 [Purpureocillium takamizusanense]UNI22374.1 hypothetical protein JDV02_008269 [Purpureocillium takamizusanense]
MRSPILLSCLLAGPAALAADLAQAVGGIAIGVPPAPTPPPVAAAPLDRRAIDRQCLSSVVSELSPPTSGVDSKLISWATRQAATLGGVPAGCTITAPASLSSAYGSYLDILRTYFSTIESKAKGINTKCGADKVSLTFSQGCTSSLTLLYTDATATKTTSYSNVDVPKKTIFLGEGSGSGSGSGNGGGSGSSGKDSAAAVSAPVVGSAVALAAVLAVALAL